VFELPEEPTLEDVEDALREAQGNFYSGAMSSLAAAYEMRARLLLTRYDVNERKKAALRVEPEVISDREGDIWTRQEDGTYDCAYGPKGCTLEDIKRTWGPVTTVGGRYDEASQG
jgi:hypothetical protein